MYKCTATVTPALETTGVLHWLILLRNSLAFTLLNLRFNNRLEPRLQHTGIHFSGETDNNSMNSRWEFERKCHGLVKNINNSK